MAGFDPRRHSAVCLAVKERQTVYSNKPGSAGSTLDTPLKSFMVGPNKPDAAGISSLHKPARGAPPSQYNKKNGDAHPGFLNPNGKWTQDAMTLLIAESQAQPLCATGTLTATMTGKHGGDRPVRPLTSVYTYNDISPVVTAQPVQDGSEVDPVATMRAPAKTMDDSRPVGGGQAESLEWTAKSTIGRASERVQSVSAFWNKLNGAYNLKIGDLSRVDPLGKNVVPGTPNARLIGGRWCHLDRPVEGDVVYTDYYGRCGEDSCNYYGRKYDVATTAFSQSHLVDDNDYIKVGASMAGVHSLRTRPGLSLDASVISGPSARLEKLSPYTVGSARGVHKVTAHARLRGTERPAWVN
uniref:Uncharacterized protein n=1 Tax=Chlamydomonas euryale TaxID=1486919 RepID=A0A7R9VVR2_9CHLO|mmetsp:Transcript_45131/g.134777  ORF Transcript_45131/g.134777 Transcript_45131/m.134777 type:complete len:354 (+) Transcript_45131:93-1154(+)